MALQTVALPKAWYQSWTLIINGLVFAGSGFVGIVTLLTGQNLLGPIVGIFFRDPTLAANIVQQILMIYSIINILLRFKTTQPVALKK